MAFEAVLLNAWDVLSDQSLLAANVRRFLDASLQKSTRYFIIIVLDFVRQKGRCNM